MQAGSAPERRLDARKETQMQRVLEFLQGLDGRSLWECRNERFACASDSSAACLIRTTSLRHDVDGFTSRNSIKLVGINNSALKSRATDRVIAFRTSRN